MNKSFNKYKKSCWISTRLSKFHRSEVAYQKMIASTMTAQSLAIIRQIQSSTSTDKAGKAKAINNVVLNNLIKINELLTRVKTSN